MKNYVQPAEVVEFTAPAGGVKSGDGVKIGDVFVIATVDAAAGERFNGLRLGMVTGPKLTSQPWTEGQQVNWDTTQKKFTTLTGGHFRVGMAGKAAAANDDTGYVILHGGNLGAALA